MDSAKEDVEGDDFEGNFGNDRSRGGIQTVARMRRRTHNFCVFATPPLVIIIYKVGSEVDFWGWQICLLLHSFVSLSLCEKKSRL